MRTKAKLLAKFLAHLAELNGHEDVAKAVTVGINTCCFTCFLLRWHSNDEDLKSDYLTWKWHRNKMYTRFLCLSFGSIIIGVDRACCEIVLLSTSCDIFSSNFSEELSKENKMNLS